MRRLWGWLKALLLRFAWWRRKALPSVAESAEIGDPWAEQRARPGLWVALADAARKGG